MDQRAIHANEVTPQGEQQVMDKFASVILFTLGKLLEAYRTWMSVSITEIGFSRF